MSLVREGDVVSDTDAENGAEVDAVAEPLEREVDLEAAMEREPLDDNEFRDNVGSGDSVGVKLSLRD